MANHMMVDLESMSTQPDALLLSLGFVVFDDKFEVVGSHYTNLEILPQLLRGRHVDPGTQKWWKEQDPDAVGALFGDEVSPYEAFSKMSLRYETDNCQTIWAHGICFDVSVIEHTMRENDIHIPWKYNQVRDLRSISRVCPEIAAPVLPTNHIPHHALSDCLVQLAELKARVTQVR